MPCWSETVESLALRATPEQAFWLGTIVSQVTQYVDLDLCPGDTSMQKHIAIPDDIADTIESGRLILYGDAVYYCPYCGTVEVD
jgi:hypothetical protein